MSNGKQNAWLFKVYTKQQHSHIATLKRAICRIETVLDQRNVEVFFITHYHIFKSTQIELTVLDQRVVEVAFIMLYHIFKFTQNNSIHIYHYTTQKRHNTSNFSFESYQQ